MSQRTTQMNTEKKFQIASNLKTIMMAIMGEGEKTFYFRFGHNSLILQRLIDRHEQFKRSFVICKKYETMMPQARISQELASLPC